MSRLLLSMTLLLIVALCAYSLTYDDDTTLHFYWTPASGAVDHYDVYVSIDGGTSTKVGSTILPTADDPYALPLVATHGSTYVVTVQAVDIAGDSGPMSEPSDLVECKLGNTGLPPVPYGG